MPAIVRFGHKGVDAQKQTGGALVKNTFYAHSTDNHESDWQLLSDHLNGVGELAGAFAKPGGFHALASVAGKLHDIGKCTDKFQQRLRGGPPTDHATAGAQIAAERYGEFGRLIAYGIAGHHTGLANGRYFDTQGLPDKCKRNTSKEEQDNARRSKGDRSPLSDRLLKAIDVPLLAHLTDVELPPPGTDLTPIGRKESHRPAFQQAMLTRMTFSCLADADFIDTDRFYARIKGKPSSSDIPRPDLGALRDRLDAFVAARQPKFEIDRTRAEVLAHARARACDSMGVFSLTVPTGGGKTLTSLAFALDHAIAHGLKRVIFVIPFTSIVEQTAAVFREVFGELGDAAVVEHHSAFVQPDKIEPDAKDRLRVIATNWDAPVIVTTSVQFFESLYATRPAQCRKLHNMMSSVIILDEAQALPLKLLLPCVAALDELALNYRASIVLCTATQPALNAPQFEGGFTNVRELAPDPERLFETLARVTVKVTGPLDDDELTRRLREHDRVLCIVNNRKHAQALFASIEKEPGARHLSTLMFPKHRSEVLKEVRAMLKDEKPCRLVSTSLIEAGVDVDFPYVMRAEAGLDSIAQAAGRCNRSGKRTRAESMVDVFATTNPDWKPPVSLVALADIAKEIVDCTPGDPLSIATINAYFRAVYWQRGSARLDECALLQRIHETGINGFPFEYIDQMFQMIDNVQMPVIIPADSHCRDLLARLPDAESRELAGIAQQLQSYLIQIPAKLHNDFLRSGVIEAVAEDRFGQQFIQLVSMTQYSDQYGLRIDGSMDVSGLIQ